ncbi:SRPBCC family protein [Actinomycetospora sp.]|jgi:hypothetical protein|uniref:SRPBCC family protein n=1 Tax=Actinomycetospora sp. TaxID=1872135 RepID=UPI002F402E39
MNRRDKAALVMRERRAELEQTLLNRALRHDKGPVDRVVTRLVAATLPDTSTVAPKHAGVLDRPDPTRPRGVVSSDTVADRIVEQENPSPMSEPTASASVTVAASAEQVYALVSDLPRMGRWSPENTGGRWIGQQRGPAAGARFVGTNKGARRWWPTTTVVTDANPGRRFAFVTQLGPLTAAEWAYDIAPTDDGGCVLTESWVDRRPDWLLVVGRHLTGVDDRVAHTRRMLDTTLANLKVAVESGR